MSHSAASRPTVLVFIRHYLPGFEFGGPVRSVSNLVENLGDSFAFRIVTLDRDVSSRQPHEGITPDEWTDVGKAKVYYASPEACSMRGQALLMKRTAHDLIYLNSFFDKRFTVWPLLARRLGLVERRPTVLAPRGEFSEGAIRLKRWKKAPFLSVAMAAGLFNDLVWQASSEYEADDIRRRLGNRAGRIVIASNLPQTAAFPKPAEVRRNAAEPLRVLFLSRITHKKNLDFAIRALAGVRHPVAFTIAGTMEHPGYWAECNDLLRRLPPHVQASYMGPVNPSDVPRVMAGHDLFFLPTRGENYGHVIAEALQAGTPALISDATPWKGLAQFGAGWDLPLLSESAFAERIDECADMPEQAYRQLRQRASEFATQFIERSASVAMTRHMFMDALACPSR